MSMTEPPQPDQVRDPGLEPAPEAPSSGPGGATAVATERRPELAPLGVRPAAASVVKDTVFDVQNLSVSYGKALAVGGVTMDIYKNAITALIGPSGCGKSTFLRCLNRMNDLVPSAVIEGKIIYHGTNLYGAGVDPIEVRRRIGMVFQRPNPFPKSIYDNVAFGLRILGMKDSLDDRVEKALRGAAIWDEVKNRLKRSALGLSGGQQQRLCIARAIAVEPDVILLDEPASALDPISTQAIEDLMDELKRDYTLVIVTHNMQQAARVAEMTAFFSLQVEPDGSRHGILVEYDSTEKIFTQPADERTEGYVTGRFG
jgi:phosphate transport system ATP-binding protein